MVDKSYGKMRGTRKKLRKKNYVTVNRKLQKFSIDDKVRIDIRSSSIFPHPRFNNKTGKIIAKSGRSYVVEFTDFSKKKKMILRPEHIKKIGD